MDNSEVSTADWRQYVTFLNEDRAYGVPITDVREIRQWSATTDLPNQPHYTRGVLNIRGEIIPVHDLRARLGGPLTETTETHAIVIVSVHDQHVGILVDAVSDIVDIDMKEVKPVPSGAMADCEPAVLGLFNQDEHMIALLDLPHLFGQQDEMAA